MAATPARERSASAGLLSIGQVLARLTPEFPDLTSSKLRFLEVQGIVSPSRTESGYRKFSASDIERLRLGLTLQRDHYLPLSVIREQLDDVDAGGEATPLAPPPSITPAPRRYRRDELLAAAGAGPQLLNDAISTGVIIAQESYQETTVTLLRRPRRPRPPRHRAAAPAFPASGGGARGRAHRIGYVRAAASDGRTVSRQGQRTRARTGDEDRRSALALRQGRTVTSAFVTNWLRHTFAVPRM